MVIETTVTLDPVKDAEIVKALREKPEWKIKKQLTTAITFHYFWHGDLVDMPLYGLKQEVSDNG